MTASHATTRLEFVRRYDGLMLDGATDGLYGDSEFFNVGYWSPATPDQVTACESLVNRLIEWVPATARRLLDVGCGCGATSRHLKGRFPSSQVVGINISPRQLERCLAHPSGCTFVLMDAAKLAFGGAAFDCVFSVEAAFHFDTREAFLREAWRVLRPGGRLALSDILFASTAWVGDWMVPPENAVRDLEGYRALLSRAGFVRTEVRDATDVCWKAFCRWHMQWAETLFRAAAIDERTFAAKMRHLEGLLSASLGYYALVAAEKPVESGPATATP